MKILGLTGGIASGKTTIRRILEQRFNYIFIDADEMAKEAVLPGSEGLTRIVESFGPGVLEKNGELNRKLLGKMIAENSEDREKLNQILHPIIKEMYKKQCAFYEEKGVSFLIFDCPLLFEAGFNASVDETMLVIADKEIRIQRIMERDGGGREFALKKIEMQMSDEKKILKSQIIIENNGSKEDLLITLNQFFSLIKPWTK
ncbi:MAG: dephospho-CoA kinase [Eubacteriaceae bacterium]